MQYVDSRHWRVNRRNLNLVIEHTVTCDLPDGQVCPPYFEDGVIWCVVKRRSGQTLWRRIRLGDAS
jgi:hypothetical protein